ncbi:MAG: hypothetical protein A2W17_12365 [Planctomycetes bacterium RBG_16_41_13]|nr:MAG: hypothetical protein A2W17_12365 [Planctomycetes bacterium RBG_16_41_13]
MSRSKVFYLTGIVVVLLFALAIWVIWRWWLAQQSTTYKQPVEKTQRVRETHQSKTIAAVDSSKIYDNTETPLSATNTQTGKHSKIPTKPMPLEWLMSSQNDDGSWGDNNSTVLSGNRYDKVGATALALLSFSGRGYTHLSEDKIDGKKIGDVVKKAIDWLISNQSGDGSVGSPHSIDFGLNHSIAALALSEVYGITNESQYKDAAQKATTFLQTIQNRDGGWGSEGRELSYPNLQTTGWTIMALKSAQICGLDIGDSFKKAESYVADKLKDHWEPLPAAMYIFVKREKNKDLEDTMDYLIRNPPSQSQQDYLYWYFGSIALFQYDGPDGNYWKKWNKPFKETVMEKLYNDDLHYGSPNNRTEQVVNASLLTLSLEIYYRYDIIFHPKD